MESVRVSLTVILIGVLYSSSPSAAFTFKPLPATNPPTNGSRPNPKAMVLKQGSGSIPCGSHVLSPGQVVTIQSENYPSNYPPNSLCEWEFKGTSPITINCNVFKLKKWQQSIMVILGGYNVKWYHKTKVFSETSTGNSMTVYFRTTSDTKTKKGFSCQVSASGTTSSTTSTSTSTSTTSTTSTPSTSCRCGRTNPITRIVGGQETTVHEYPWQVLLIHDYFVFCGGSIISNEWVLTAAHCIVVFSNDPQRDMVVIGEHDWSNWLGETAATEIISVTQIVGHPGYNPNTYDNDIALLRIATPITFKPDNKIAPVCLPDLKNNYEAVDAIVTGWGATTLGDNMTPKLQEVTVPTMTNSKCQSKYLALYGPNSITSNMICAGLDAGGKDSCKGDSGGPMVTELSGSQAFMIQIGVVSWGEGCALPNYPGVYTRLNNYFPWIDSVTSGLVTCPRP